jgi:hypothetical protein
MNARISALAAAMLIVAPGASIAQGNPFAGRTLDPATLKPATHASVAGGSTTVSFRPGPRPTVEVWVNGKGPLVFNVEATGGATELSVAAAERLGIPVRREGTNLPVVTLDSLRVGTATMTGITAVGAETLPAEVDGILGLGTLAELLVTFDPGARTLTLAEGSLPAPNGRDLLPLVSAGPFWNVGRLVGVEIDAGGQRGVAVLNLQSPSSVTAAPSVAAGVSFAAPPVVAGRVVGPVLGNVERRLGRLAGDLRVGAYTFQRPLVNVVPLPPQVPQSWALGAAALRGFVITFDQKDGVVRLARADTSPIPAPPSVRDFGFDVGGPGMSAITVARVAPGSPAERAGVQPGDELVAADGRAAAQLDGAAWRTLLARTDAVTFRFRRGSAERELALHATTLVQ